MSSRTTHAMKKRHVDLIHKLSNHFDPSVDKEEYDRFRHSCRLHLDPMSLKKSTNLLETLECMEKKGLIQPGKYDVLKEIVCDFNVPLLESIEDAEKDIKSLRDAEDEKTKSDHQSPNHQASSSNQVPPAGWIFNRGDKELGPTAPKRSRQEDDAVAIPEMRKYSCDNQKGLLVIINFRKHREGSEQDEEALIEFFGTTLKWDIDKRRDLSYDKMDRYLSSVQERLDDRDSCENLYCFVLAVMGHGNEKGIYVNEDTRGEKDVYPYDKIFDNFKNDKIVPFAGKPKVFLIQSCRGSATQREVQGDSEPMEQEPTLPPEDTRIAVPVDADLLIVWSTTPGYQSFRRTYSGSFFINEILKQFKENYGTHHVEDILIKLRYEFAYTKTHRRESFDGTVKRQMPCSWSTLTKMLYLYKYS